MSFIFNNKKFENNLINGPVTCRLWHQLTLKLETFVKHPALQKEDNLVQLYNNFLSTFENK